MLCFGCGNEIPDGTECPVCESGRARKRPSPAPVRNRSTLCRGCGNEIEVDAECRVCAAGRGARKPRDGDTSGDDERTKMCRGCGNEVPASRPCAICEDRTRRTAASSEPAMALCRGCGNTVPADKPCPICASNRNTKGAKKLVLCVNCGNEVEDPANCPICESGRSSGRKRVKLDVRADCPRCGDELTEQMWEDVQVLMCGHCQGTLFPLDGLERTLDKLRAAVEGAALPDVLREFRDRLTRKLPGTVRYKNCPVCKTLMTRRNYAGSSGVIIDHCGKHGTWCDQAAFQEIAEFISRGGDVLAARNPLNRKK